MNNKEINIKVLFLTQMLPYPMDSGGKIRSYYFIKALSEKYEVILVSFIRLDKEKENFGHLMRFCKEIKVCKIKRSLIKNIIDAFKSIILGRSFIILRDYVPEMKALVDHVLVEEQPDFIHIDHLQMAQYIGENVKGIKILDEHNVEYKIIERISQAEKNIFKKAFAYFEYKKLKIFEKKAVLNSNLTIPVTNVDKEILVNLTEGQANVKTIHTGVDTKDFSYRPADKKQRNSVVFIGTLYWPPNIDAVMWFYQNVWLEVRKKIREEEGFSDFKWEIIGLNPAKEVLELSEIDKDIEIHGSVKDIKPYMWEGGIFIVPLFSGSGIRVKILNAMSCGIPVISTALGAEGIDGLKPITEYDPRSAAYDPNIWIADRPEKFVEAIITLFKNKDLREKLSMNGRKLMEEKYNWDAQGKKLMIIYEEILKNGKV